MKKLTGNIRALVLLAPSFLLVTGCSDEPVPPKNRGELIATLNVGKDLEAKLKKDFNFDAQNNCVQLVGRDTTVDKIRHVSTVVIFSPDACPTEEGKVADREAFYLDATREPLVPAGMGGGNYPALAYSLVLNAPGVKEVVGTVMLVDEVADQEIEEAPAMPVYELGDVCTLIQEHEEMCGLIFTHDGRFNQIDSNRAAVGARKRAKRTTDGLKRHMEEMRNTLSTQLNQVQRNLMTRIDRQLEALQNAIRSEQRLLAVQMVDNLQVSLDDLGDEINANQNVAAKNVLEELRKEMRALHAENIRVLKAEIKDAVTQTKAAVYDVHRQLKDQLTAAESAILARITNTAIKLGTVTVFNQWLATLSMYSALSSDLKQLYTKVEGRIDAQTANAIWVLGVMNWKFKRDVLIAMRAEIVAPAKKLRESLFEGPNSLQGKVEAMNKSLFEGPDSLQGKIESTHKSVFEGPDSLKEKIVARLKAIEDSQTSSAKTLADELPELKKAIRELEAATGRKIDAVQERLLVRIEAALLDETKAALIVTSGVLEVQLGAVSKVFAEAKVAEKEAAAAARFEALSKELKGGGTPAEQLTRVEEMRALVVKLAKIPADLDEPQFAAINNVRITLRDYATTALRLEHFALVVAVHKVLDNNKMDPKVADRFKRLSSEFASASFADRPALAGKLVDTFENYDSDESDAMTKRLKSYSQAVIAEQKLRDREKSLRP